MADELWKSLQTQDRLIKLTIGTDGCPPIYIQQKVLESVAPWFENALKRDTFVEGQTGSLSFPEDDPDAWKVLVCWIVKHTYSVSIKDTEQEEGTNLDLAAKCWVLGDKYDIKPFQDEAMMSILAYFETRYVYQLSWETVNRVLDVCPSRSKVAKYMTSEIANSMMEGDISWSSASSLHLGHIWEDFCMARSECDARGWNLLDAGGFKAPRLSYRRGGQYMVGKKVLGSVDAESDIEV